MTADSFGRKRRNVTLAAPRMSPSSDHIDRSAEYSWGWLPKSLGIGAVGILALVWALSGATTTAGEHCRSNGAGSDSCGLAAAEPFITCGWLKCGGIFSSADESTHERLAREDRVKLAQEKQKRASERVERALQGERSGENRKVIGNRLD